MIDWSKRTVFLSGMTAGVLSAAIVAGLAGCKEETKKTETTVQTDPAGEPAKVEEKTTTEEKK